MKKFSLPRWLILVLAIFLFLVLAAEVAFGQKLPREVTSCIRYLGKCDFDSFVIFCADSVLIGEAFSDDCEMMEKRGLIKCLKENKLPTSTSQVLFQKFPKGFRINHDKEKNEIICYRLFSKPPAWIVFRQEKGIWKLEVLGIYGFATKEDSLTIKKDSLATKEDK